MKIKQTLKDEKGQALVEAALVLPILSAIFLGILIFGLMINAKIVVVDAARDGARHYALGLHTSTGVSVQEKVVESITNGWSLKPERVQPVRIEDNGTYVKVTVQYRQPVFVPGLRRLLGGDEDIGEGGYFSLEHSALFKKEF